MFDHDDIVMLLSIQEELSKLTKEGGSTVGLILSSGFLAHYWRQGGDYMCQFEPKYWAKYIILERKVGGLNERS